MPTALFLGLCGSHPTFLSSLPVEKRPERSALGIIEEAVLPPRGSLGACGIFMLVAG